MKIDTQKRKGNKIIVYLENSRGGINFERFFMALSLFL